MKKYKVLVAFEYEGVEQAVDTVLELSEEVAAPLVSEGKVVEEVADATPAE